MSMEGYHKSVLLREAVDALIPARPRQDDLASVGRDAWYLDLTLGDGGHSIEIIKRGGRVVGIDVDPQALERARKRFKDEGISEDRFKLVRGNFRDLKNLIQSSFAKATEDKQTETKFDGAKLRLSGVLFDLGVSSLQLDNPERGFSFLKSGPLDMRMDPSLQVQALDLINVLSRKELYELFNDLGEEKYSWRLADTLVRAREVGKVTGERLQGIGIETTRDLARLVEQAYRRFGIRDSKVHPATRVFQALRITVNSELDALKEGLEQAKEVVEKDGHIVVISFHSLEDRIVKNTFKKWEVVGIGEILTEKPVMPGEAEIAGNPRSRSAKMRVFEKI